MPIDTSDWPQEDRLLKAKVPGTVRLLGLCDPHMTPHNPPAYKVDYWPLLKETLETGLRFAKEHQVDAMVWAGDLYHLKSATRNPIRFLGETVRWFRRANLTCPQVGIVGNHDVLYGSLEQGYEGQPVELLDASGVYQLLDRNELVIDAEAFTVRVAGGSYRHAQASHVKGKTKKGADKLLSVGHFWFGGQSGEFFGEPIYGPDYLSPSEVDVYLIGHHHEDQGVTKVGDVFYVSPGSVSRTGTHAHDLERRPAMVLVTFDQTGTHVQLLRPKVPPPAGTAKTHKRHVLMDKQRRTDKSERISRPT
jgi:DNA repair exonuclease SbcCD nuclease subunit